MTPEDAFGHGALPEDLLAYSRESNPAADISSIADTLHTAQATLSETEAEIAVGCAACLADASATTEECLRCLSGQIQLIHQSAEDLVAKLGDKAARPIQEIISNAISTGNTAGIPITELLTSTATEEFGAPASPPLPTPISVSATLPTPAAGQSIQATIGQPSSPADQPSSPIASNPGTNAARDEGPADVYRYTSPGCTAGLQSAPPPQINQLTYVGETSPGYKLWIGQADGFHWTVNWSSLRDKDCQWEVVTAPVVPGSGLDQTITPIIPPDRTTATSTVTGGCGPLGAASFCNPARVAESRQRVTALKSSLGSDSAGIGSKFYGAAGGTGGSGVSLTSIFTDPLGVGTSFVLGIATGITKSIISALDTSRIFQDVCGDNAFSAVAALQAVSNVFGGWFGIVPRQVTKNNEYAINLICPYLIPSAADANVLWNQGLLNDDQWSFVVEANGYCPEWQRIIRDSMQTRPGVRETIDARRRQIIDDAEYNDLLQKSGLYNDRYREIFFQLSDYIPGPNDLVRFMVRDVFDEAVVDELELDAEFDQKFTGKAKDWAAAQGISEDVFRYQWRSHWQAPSNAALYEMLHRIRKDKKIPGSNRIAKAVNADEVASLIQINDMLPTWIDRLMAISYKPLGRRDMQRLYQSGVIDDDGLKDAFLDNGVSPEVADQLVAAAKKTWPRKVYNPNGRPDEKEILKWYQQGVISHAQAVDLFVSLGTDLDRWHQLLETADQRIIAARRVEIGKALRRRYMMGEFSDDELSATLSQAGYDPDRIPDIVFEWRVIRDARYKAPTVGKLCEWWQRHYITIDEFTRRVVNMGYSVIDAARIVQECSDKQHERQVKDLEKLNKQAVSAEEKRLKQLKQAQKDAEKAYKAGLPCTPQAKPKCGPPLKKNIGTVALEKSNGAVVVAPSDHYKEPPQPGGG